MEFDLEKKFNKKIVLDISTLPLLNDILYSASKSEENKIEFFLPDTLSYLLEKEQRNILNQLIKRWTRKKVNFKYLEDFFIEKKAITKIMTFPIYDHMVDDSLYKISYEDFYSKKFIVNFSPERNLLGDIIGKTIGFAKKEKAIILMRTRNLLREIRKDVSILEDAVRDTHNRKIAFFERYFPGLRGTTQTRWIIGYFIDNIEPFVNQPILTSASYLMRAIDP